jgi:hypothetical protein
MKLTKLLTFTVAAGVAAPLYAGTLNMTAGGMVTDWGVTPQLGSQTNIDGGSGSYFYTQENDYAPINYPHNVGYNPSPGGVQGEAFDLEEMHVRVNNSGQFQVLVVSSTGPQSGNFYLGDLMLNVDGTDYAVASHNLNRATVQTGDVYAVDAGDTNQLQSGSGSYLHNNKKVASEYFATNEKVRDIAGPWQVKDGVDQQKKIGNATINTAYYDYGGDEDGTYLIEYTIDALDLGIMGDFVFSSQITWGCGNDVIRTEGSMAGITNIIPSPVAAGPALLLMLGGLARRRRAS